MPALTQAFRRTLRIGFRTGDKETHGSAQEKVGAAPAL
jgi:hypothetical protein